MCNFAGRDIVAVAENPDDARATIAYALNLAQLGRVEEARKSVLTALDLSPSGREGFAVNGPRCLNRNPRGVERDNEVPRRRGETVKEIKWRVRPDGDADVAAKGVKPAGSGAVGVTK